MFSLRFMSNILTAVALLAFGSVCGCPAAGPNTPPPPPRLVPMAQPVPAAPRLAIVGDLDVNQHKLARLSVTGAPAGATLDWDVTPEALAEVEEIGDRLVLTGPPGVYRVTVRAMYLSDGKIVSVRARAVVTIRGTAPAPTPPSPPAPPVPPTPGPGGKADPVAATARLTTEIGGCTITPVYPRRTDGRWDMACAAHCVQGIGAKGVAAFADGLRLDVVCTAHKGGAKKVVNPDMAWFTTVRTDLADLPFVYLASALPQVGTPVWQNGYGVKTKRRVFEGAVKGEVSGGMLAFDLVVSPGDSGGGIYRKDTGEMLATVCCTPKDRNTPTYGASCLTLAALRPLTGPLPSSLEVAPSPCLPCPPDLVPMVDAQPMADTTPQAPVDRDHPIVQAVLSQVGTTGAASGGIVGLLVALGVQLLQGWIASRKKPATPAAPPSSAPTPPPGPSPSKN